MRFDLLISGILGVMIGLGVPGLIIRRIKSKGSFKSSPRKDNRIAGSDEDQDL